MRIPCQPLVKITRRYLTSLATTIVMPTRAGGSKPPTPLRLVKGTVVVLCVYRKSFPLVHDIKCGLNSSSYRVPNYHC